MVTFTSMKFVFLALICIYMPMTLTEYTTIWDAYAFGKNNFILMEICHFFEVNQSDFALSVESQLEQCKG